jgi:hypothetical protein
MILIFSDEVMQVFLQGMKKICELFAGTKLLPGFAKICWEAKDKNFALVL